MDRRSLTDVDGRRWLDEVNRRARIDAEMNAPRVRAVVERSVDLGRSHGHHLAVVGAAPSDRGVTLRAHVADHAHDAGVRRETRHQEVIGI